MVAFLSLLLHAFTSGVGGGIINALPADSGVGGGIINIISRPSPADSGVAGGIIN